MKNILLCLFFAGIVPFTFGQKPTGLPQKRYPINSKFTIETKNGLDFNGISENAPVEFVITNCVSNDRQLEIEAGFKVMGQISKIEKPTLFKKTGKIEIVLRSLQFKEILNLALNQVIEFPYDKSTQPSIVESEIILKSPITIDTDYNKLLLSYYENSFSSTIDEYIFNKKLKFITNSRVWEERQQYKISDSVNFLNTKVKHPDYLKHSSMLNTSIINFKNQLFSNNKAERDNAFRGLYFLHYNEQLLLMELGKNTSRGLNYDDPAKYFKSEYTYLPKSGLLLYHVFNNSFGKGDYSLYFYVMHPIFGPLKISQSPSGLKLLINQKMGIDFSTFSTYSDYIYTKEHHPYTSGNTCRISSLDGYISIDGEWGDYEKYQKTDYYDEIINLENNEQFKLGKKYITIPNNKEYKYYPTYEEKIVLYSCCSLPRIDLINPNFFIYKRAEDKQIVKYTLLNKNLTALTYPKYFDEITEAENNYFITKFNGRFGLLCMNQANIEQNNIVLIENKFDKIVYLKNGIFELSINDKKEFIDFTGNLLTREKR